MALPLSYNIRNIAVRWQVTVLAVGGIALVVAVLLVLTAMANGFRMALRATGSPAERDRHPARLDGGADVGHVARQRQHDHGGLARGPRRAGPAAGLAGNRHRGQPLPERSDAATST